MVTLFFVIVVLRLILYATKLYIGCSQAAFFSIIVIFTCNLKLNLASHACTKNLKA